MKVPACMFACIESHHRPMFSPFCGSQQRCPSPSSKQPSMCRDHMISRHSYQRMPRQHQPPAERHARCPSALPPWQCALHHPQERRSWSGSPLTHRPVQSPEGSAQSSILEESCRWLKYKMCSASALQLQHSWWCGHLNCSEPPSLTNLVTKRVDLTLQKGLLLCNAKQDQAPTGLSVMHKWTLW